MIIVKRLSGSEFALNPDLIERIETAPDTILVMVDGARFIVENSLAEVVALVREDRARVLLRTKQLLTETVDPLAPLEESLQVSPASAMERE